MMSKRLAEYRKNEAVANKLRMLKEIPCLLVEGETDQIYWKKFILRECFIQSGNGKVNLKRIIEMLNFEEGDLKFLALVDLDYDRILKRIWKYENVIFTDENDFEVMILKDEALYNYLDEFVGEENLTWFEKHYEMEFSEYLFYVASYIGAIRLYSQIKNLHFSLKNLQSLNEYSLKEITNIDVLIDKVLILSQEEKKLVIKEILEIRKSFGECNICNGHDLTNVMSVILREYFKVKKTREEIEIGLRLAYDSAYLKDTELFKSILKWERLKDTSIINKRFLK